MILIILVTTVLLYFNQQANAQYKERLIKKTDSLITLLPKQKEDSLKAESIRSIASAKLDLAQHTGNWDDPIEWTHRALKLSIKTGYKWGTGRCYWQLGICWMKKANYPEAIKYFSEGVKTSFKNNNKNLRLACYHYMADCYMSLGKYDEVLKVSLSAIEILNQMSLSGEPDNGGDLEHFSMKMGNAYANLHNYTKALNWFEKVLKKHRIVSEDAILLSIASAQMGMKNYKDALKSYLAALRILTSDKKINEKPDTEFNGLLGGLYKEIGNVYYKMGLIKHDSTSILSYKEAIKYLDKSLPLLNKGAAGQEALMNAYSLLKQVCEVTNDFQNALYYNNLYTSIKDSIYSKENYLKIADLQVKYETEKASAALKIKEEKEKIRNDSILANQKIEEERKLTEQKLAQQNELVEAKAAADKLMAIEKEKQEKIVAKKQQINNLLLTGFAIMIIISLFTILLFRQQQQKKRAVEKAEAIQKMTALELQSLRAQLNPHFMFNSLNSIQALILKEENEKSQSYLSRFAKLLRLLLENADKPFIPLTKEIDFLKLYLSLETLRIPDLQYSISMDPAVNTEIIFIPNMILQPYVENAIWHGLSYKEGNKHLQIRIIRANGILKYEIEDNGVGRKKAEEMKSLFRKQTESKGMELLNKRFKLLSVEYNSKIQTSITDIIKENKLTGTLVTITMSEELYRQFQNS